MSLVEHATRGAVACITLNRPEKLGEALATAGTDDAVRALLLDGNVRGVRVTTASAWPGCRTSRRKREGDPT